jgi:hypothetical protein
MGLLAAIKISLWRLIMLDQSVLSDGGADDRLLHPFDRAIKRLFDRLSGTWGRDFMDQWAGLHGGKVMAIWAHELSGYDARTKPNPEAVDGRALMQPIAWALENLPEKPLNAIQFRALCRRAPAAEVLRLPEPAANPARMAEALEKLAPLRKGASAGALAGGKGWAHRLIEKHERGEFVNVGPLRTAREALGLLPGRA